MCKAVSRKIKVCWVFGRRGRPNQWIGLSVEGGFTTPSWIRHRSKCILCATDVATQFWRRWWFLWWSKGSNRIPKKFVWRCCGRGADNASVRDGEKTGRKGIQIDGSSDCQRMEVLIQYPWRQNLLIHYNKPITMKLSNSSIFLEPIIIILLTLIGLNQLLFMSI